MLVFALWSDILTHWQAFYVYVALIPLMEVVELLTLPTRSLLQVVDRSLVRTGFIEGFWGSIISVGISQYKNLKCKNSTAEILSYPHLFTEGAVRAFGICSCHRTKSCQRLGGNFICTERVHICSVWFLMQFWPHWSNFYEYFHIVLDTDRTC